MTNLYHDCAESEHVCFLCDFISHENLWRSPAQGKHLRLGYKNGVHSANDRGKPEICQAGATAMIHKDVGLAKGY